MAVMLVAFVAPAMAQGNGNSNDRQLDQHYVRLDRQLLNDNDHQGFFGIKDDRNQIDEFGFFPSLTPSSPASSRPTKHVHSGAILLASSTNGTASSKRKVENYTPCIGMGIGV
jgi:hypothetical protein